jgi:hypothetical protein
VLVLILSESSVLILVRRARLSTSRRVDDPVELGVHRDRVGLVIHRVQQRFDPTPGGFRADGHQVRRVVGAAVLPGRAGQRGAEGGDQAGVGVGLDSSS